MYKKLFNLLLSVILIFSLIFGIGGNNFVHASDDPSGSDGSDEEIVFVPDEVVALADSLEHAEEIAEAYDLELVSFAFGVAVYHSDDPEQEVDQSEELDLDGIPELSLNFVYELFYTAVEYETQSEYQTMYSAQWHHAEMDTANAHNLGHSGAGVVIAVIDTGIDIDHSAFYGRLSALSYNSYTRDVGLAYVREDYTSHGTHVSGTIAASRDFAANTTGVAPGATLMVIKANSPTTNTFTTDSIIGGINYAVDNGAHIINLSLGRPLSGGESSVERNAIINAVNKGVLVVCAAGNDREGSISYPAAYPEAVAVTATRQGYMFADDYSNFGPQVDVSAPGSAIYATVIGGYGYMSGTSMAAGNVSGVAALIIGQNRSLSVQQVRDKLSVTSRDAGAAGFDIYFGHGVVNAFAAVSSVNLSGMEQFLERLYVTMLGRSADREGLNYWLAALNNGMTGQKAAENFVYSNEFVNKNMTNEVYLQHMYRGLLGREADREGLDYWEGVMNRAPSLEQAKRTMFIDFANSNEFRSICASFGVRAN